jgi:co-chaperonin GroES (HSP10)
MRAVRNDEGKDSYMRRKGWMGAIAVATTCAFIGAAGGIAPSGAATSSGTAKTKTTTATATHGMRPDFGGRGGGPSVHSVSEQLNKAGTAFIEVTRDEGTVTAVSGSVITLHEGTKTVAYKDATITIAAGATVTRNDATAALTDIKVGDRVSISQSSESTEVRAYDPTFEPRGFHGDHDDDGGPGGPGGPPRLANPSGSAG